MIATYRIQLTPDFGFDAAREQLDYLAELGISHLYLSPVTEARSGSEHGYDVIDHNRLRSDYGGEDAFERLREAAVEKGLTLVLDFVPNHAYVGPHNEQWQDVLAYGPHSVYAEHFDIDWSPLKEELQDKILLPFLGDTYGEVLDEDEVGLTYRDGRFWARYYENQFALCPATYHRILAEALEVFEETEPYWALKDLHESFASLERDAREKAETLCSRLDQVVEPLDLEPVFDRFTREKLHGLLERQFWRLSFWKTAGDEVNYRRFFDINGLVALRMEDEDVFWDAHRQLGELLARDGIEGVRVDHVDGLFDPHTYLDRLDDLGASRIWVEKILAPGETLPPEWPVEGTTGYEFMNDALGVLLDPEGELPLDRTYHRFVDQPRSWTEEVYRSKRLVMTSSLSSERFRLSYELDRIAEADYHTRDFTLAGLRAALSEVIAALDRYRTYLPHQDEEAAEEVLREAVYRARQRNPATEPSVFAFITDVLLGRVREDLEDRRRAWAGRFQQYTGPVAAKGVEDTAFYRYLRLSALNEVGGEPGEFGRSPDAFHARARFRGLNYPHNLLATATHDHKRGEETRLRGAAIAERPDAWDELVQALSEQTRGDRRGARGPSRRDEYLLYQTLAALWADSDRQELEDRLWRYMRKASRESKRHTSWIHPDPDYEEQLKTFVRDTVRNEDVRDRLDPFAEELARRGYLKSISQLVLKCTTPGVPDFYQGTELQDLSLVDPDNRRPVDYERRANLLAELGDLVDAPNPEEVTDVLRADRDRGKYYLTARLLRLRDDYRELLRGEYQGLPLEGPASERFLAFAIGGEAGRLIGVVPRFPARIHAESEEPTSEEPLLGIPEENPDESESAPVLSHPIDAAAGAATASLPEAWASRTYREYLTRASVSVEEELRTDELPLPWAVLVAPEETSSTIRAE